MTEQDKNFPIPDSAQRLIDADREEFEREFDRRQDMSIETSEQTRRVLLKQGIGRTLMTAEDVEVEELSKIPSPTTPYNSKKKHSKYKKPRGRDPKGGGPPAHIAEEVRRAQGFLD